MKSSLSLLVSALALAGCITNPIAKKNETEPTAATASTAPAAAAAPAAQDTAAAPCAPATAAQSAAAPAKAKAGKTAKTKKKPAATKTKAASAEAGPAAAPCAAPAAATAPAPEKAAAAAAGADGRREVKGINDWTGYIQGTPASNSKFAKLKIGMGQKEVMDIAGAPTDQSMHVTGKAWIPFYVGSGKHEVWFYYKGVGRLLFADNAGFTTDTGLIGIEHDAGERGYK